MLSAESTLSNEFCSKTCTAHPAAPLQRTHACRVAILLFIFHPPFARTSCTIQLSASSAAQYTTSMAPALVVRTVVRDMPPMASNTSTTCAVLSAVKAVQLLGLRQGTGGTQLSRDSAAAAQV